MPSYLTAYHRNGKLNFEIYHYQKPYKSRDDWNDKTFTGLYEIDKGDEGKPISDLITEHFHDMEIQKMLTANSKAI